MHYSLITYRFAEFKRSIEKPTTETLDQWIDDQIKEYPEDIEKLERLRVEGRIIFLLEDTFE